MAMIWPDCIKGQDSYHKCPFEKVGEVGKYSEGLRVAFFATLFARIDLDRFQSTHA
jgi:hypothetical protein